MEIDTEKIKQTQQSTVQKIANFPAKTLNSFLSSVLEMDAGEIARQIALIDIDLYKRIRPKECLKQAWEKTDKLDKSFNITKMIKFTNDVFFINVFQLLTTTGYTLDCSNNCFM